MVANKTDKGNGLDHRGDVYSLPEKIASAFRELERLGYSTWSGLRTLGDEEIYVTFHPGDARTLHGTGEMYLAWQGNAAEILEVLSRHGLSPEWDGSDHTKILITRPDRQPGPGRVILQLGKPTHGVIASRERLNPRTDGAKPKHELSFKVKRKRKRVIVMAADLRVRSAGISPVTWTLRKPRPVMLIGCGQTRALLCLMELESCDLLPAWMTKAAQASSAVLGVSVRVTRTRHSMAEQRVQMIMRAQGMGNGKGRQVLWIL
jgi:hypothetical protein